MSNKITIDITAKPNNIDIELKEKGPQGDSAYQVWLNAGNVGTVEDYLASLKGEKGDMGDVGPQGEQGEKGDAGPPLSEADIAMLDQKFVKIDDEGYAVMPDGTRFAFKEKTE